MCIFQNRVNNTSDVNLLEWELRVLKRIKDSTLLSENPCIACTKDHRKENCSDLESKIAVIKLRLNKILVDRCIQSLRK